MTTTFSNRPLAMRLLRSPTIVALLVSSLAPPLAAQAFHGAVRDSASRQPISGAVVMLLDSSGAVLGRNITNEGGQYRVAYGRVARLMRVVRIGFLPREVRVGDSAYPDRPIDVAMIPFKTTLAAVRIADKSICPRRSDQATALALWEQARAGLLSTVVARETKPMSVRRLVFERTLEGNSDRITRFRVTGDSGANSTTSFSAARSARDFVTSGFSTGSADSLLLFGPDADVLLDDAFALGYCFRLEQPPEERPRQVGLAFAPADPRPGRVDIDGTLWVDTSARALRDIVYRYVGLPSRADGFRPGGVISFREMNNGVVFIDRWIVRRVGARQVTVPQVAGRDLGVRTVSSRTESGGELAHAVWPDGQTWNASLGSLRIHAVTSSGRPATGAEVLLPGTPYHATADSSGTILIGDLLPGPYSLAIRDARIAELDLSIPTNISFVAARNSTHRETLQVPTAEEYVAGLCRKNRQWEANDSTFILGRLVTPEGTSVDDAKVSFAVRMKNGPWTWLRWSYRTGTDGVFQSCSGSFTAGQTVAIRVSRDGLPDVDVERTITTHLTIVEIPVEPRP
jgi:hypothetical protein